MKKRILALMIAICLICVSGVPNALANIDESNLGGADGYTYIGGWSGVNNNEAWANNEDTMWKITVYVAKTDKTTNSGAYNLTDDYYKFGETFWLYANGRGISNISNKSKLLIETGNKEEYVRGGKQFEELLYEAVKTRFFKYEDYFNTGSLPRVNNFGTENISETRNFFEGNRATSNRFVELAARACNSTVETLLNSLTFTINGTSKTDWDLPMVDLRCSSDTTNDHSSCVSWVFLYEPVIIINNTLNSGYYHALTATGIAKSTLSGRYNFAHDTWSYRIVFKDSADIPAVAAQYWRWGTGFSFKSMPNSVYLTSNWLGYSSGDSFSKVTDSKYWYVEDQLEGGGFGLRYQRSELPRVVIQKYVETAGEIDLSGFDLTITSDATGSTWSGRTPLDGRLTFYLAPGTYTITEADREGYEHHEPQKFTVPAYSTTGSVINVAFTNIKNDTGNVVVTKYADDNNFNDVVFEIWEGSTRLDCTITRTLKNDANGTQYMEFSFIGVPVGTYTVKELTPMRYVKVLSGVTGDTVEYKDSVEVSVLPDATATVYFRNIISRNLEIQKTIDGNPSGDLSGFVFNLKDNLTGDSISATTGQNGKAVFTVAPGTYTLSETRRVGFEKTEDRTIVINDTDPEVITVTFNNNTLVTAGELVLSKMCDLNGSYMDVEDLEFRIRGTNGVDFTFSPFSSLSARTIATLNVNGNMFIVKVTSFSSEITTLQYADKIAGSTLTKSDGSSSSANAREFSVTINGLPPGDYTIEESTSSGWALTAISVNFGDITERTGADFNMNSGSNTYVHIENYKQNKGAIVIKKTADDGNISGITMLVNGIPYITDSEGMIYIYGLAAGSYVVYEPNPDSDRYISNTPVTVDVGMYKKTDVMFHNTVRKRIIVNYLDAYTGEKIRDSYVAYFEGIVQYDVNDKVLSPMSASSNYTILKSLDGDALSGILDSDKTINIYYGYTHTVTVRYYDMFTLAEIAGTVYSEELEHGKLYNVKSKTTIIHDGYLFVDHVSGDSLNDTLDSDRVINVFLGYDDYSGKVELKKINYMLMSVSGAVFSLYKNDGTLVKSNLVTDSLGKINIEGLAFGTYYFLETAAPTGLSVNTAKQYFVINNKNMGEVRTVNVMDMPASRKLTIIKRIKIDDIVFAHGNPTFIINISDESGNKKTGVVTVDETALADYQQNNPDADWYEASVIFQDLTSGIWTVSEDKVLRYKLADDGISVRSGTVTVEGETAKADLTALAASAEICFTNEKTNQSGTSEITLTVNTLHTGKRLSYLECEWSGGDVLTLPKPSPGDLLVTAYYDDGSTKVLTVDEYTLSPGMLSKDDNGFKVITVSYTENGFTKTTNFSVTVEIPADYYIWSVVSDTPFYDEDGTYYDGTAELTAHFGLASSSPKPSVVFGIRVSATEYINNGKVYKVVG